MATRDPVAAPGGLIAAIGTLNITQGGMPSNIWRARFQRASFRGVPFFTDIDGKSSGRRMAVHEDPKRDMPYSEDMGRGAVRHNIVGDVVGGPILGPNYIQLRDALINACEAEGPAALIHPFLGSMVVACETYTCIEDQKRGGVAMFEMNFVEAGDESGVTVTQQTQPAVHLAATNAENAVSGAFHNVVISI